MFSIHNWLWLFSYQRLRLNIEIHRLKLFDQFNLSTQFIYCYYSTVGKGKEHKNTDAEQLETFPELPPCAFSTALD